MFAAKSAQVWAFVRWPPTKRLRTAVLETVSQQLAAEGALHRVQQGCCSTVQISNHKRLLRPTCQPCKPATVRLMSHFLLSRTTPRSRQKRGRPGLDARSVETARPFVHSALRRRARQALQQATRLAVHTATSPHHQFPTVGFALCLDKKQLHHKPWRGAKRRGEEVRASWPQPEIAVRGHASADGAHNGEVKQRRRQMVMAMERGKKKRKR
ncbi:hypothetical protein HDV63DRAFT_62566 [Trichoderma sp. SZMC 28014]